MRSGLEELVASDQAGAGIGDRVLLVTGEPAARFSMEAPVDAAVVAVLDREQDHGQPGADAEKNS